MFGYTEGGALPADMQCDTVTMNPTWSVIQWERSMKKAASTIAGCIVFAYQCVFMGDDYHRPTKGQGYSLTPPLLRQMLIQYIGPGGDQWTAQYVCPVSARSDRGFV